MKLNCPVNLLQYQRCLEQIPFGKRLPGALYVVREEASDFGAELNQLLSQLVVVFKIGPEFNMIKFRTDELKVSFLFYPEFMDDPHPALRHAITIDLSSGKARHTDYASNLNPPILHRKGTTAFGSRHQSDPRPHPRGPASQDRSVGPRNRGQPESLFFASAWLFSVAPDYAE